MSTGAAYSLDNSTIRFEGLDFDEAFHRAQAVRDLLQEELSALLVDPRVRGRLALAAGVDPGSAITLNLNVRPRS